MKKPLTIAIGLFALVALTAVSPAPEKRAAPPKALEEEPNTLIVSQTTRLRNGNCVVSALLSNSAKPDHIYVGSRVFFTVVGPEESLPRARSTQRISVTPKFSMG